jgi:hypothetical protein
MTQKNILEETGMQDLKSPAKHLNFSPVTWGDWDKNTIRLDWDDTPISEVKLWTYRALVWFKLEGFMILRSSAKEYVVKSKGKIIHRHKKASYLVIFGKPVHWDTNVAVMNWTALESGNQNLQNYVRMQCIKKTSAARISDKSNPFKPKPKIVFRYGSQDRQIKKFLETRQVLLNAIKQIPN